MSSIRGRSTLSSEPLVVVVFSSGCPVVFPFMDELTYFKILDDHAAYRPLGEVSLAEGVQWITTAIAFARAQQVRKLLIDTRGLKGDQPPSTTARYLFVRQWADAAQGVVQVALVTSQRMIDPQQFGRIVAGNAGFIFNVFTAEEEALAWLLRPKQET